MEKGISKKEMEQIGFEYVKLLLEVKYGCRIDPFSGIDSEHSMDVWSPSGYQKHSIQVNMDSSIEVKEVAVLIARIIGGRKIPIITDFHMLKFLGNEGVYCLEEEKLQQLLLDGAGRSVSSADGRSMYTYFPKQLLLDHCTFIAA